jgi:hypothetical protein
MFFLLGCFWLLTMNQKQHVIAEMSRLLEEFKTFKQKVVKRCIELSKEHGIPFRLNDYDDYGSVYFPGKIDPDALVGTEFEWLLEYKERDGLPYEGEGWSSSYC